jgi:hypothetical protein
MTRIGLRHGPMRKAHLCGRVAWVPALTRDRLRALTAPG